MRSRPWATNRDKACLVPKYLFVHSFRSCASSDSLWLALAQSHSSHSRVRSRVHSAPVLSSTSGAVDCLQAC